MREGYDWPMVSVHVAKSIGLCEAFLDTTAWQNFAQFATTVEVRTRGADFVVRLFFFLVTQMFCTRARENVLA